MQLQDDSATPASDSSSASEAYRGFELDQTLKGASGVIHYNIMVPEDLDASSPVSLFVTLPGYQGLYFQGVAENLKTEDFAYTAQAYRENMVVLAPQLGDWGQTSADQTIELVESIAAHEALMEDAEDQDARGTMLWASFVETSSMLGLSIEGSWTYSIFSANGLLRFTVGTSYREGLSVMFPRWLLWVYAHHPENVRAFVVEVLGGDGNATDDELKRYAYGRLLSILERGGLPTTLDAYGPTPSRQAVADVTNKVSSKEFSVDEYCDMVEACCSAEYSTVD